MAPGTYRFHDWQSFQPSKAEIIGKREENAEKLRRWRESRKSKSNPVSNPVTNVVTDEVRNTVSNPSPDPTRPDPTNIYIESVPPIAPQTELSPNLEMQFQQFWREYPKKVDQPKSRAAFAAALKRTSLVVILAAAQRYAHDPNLPAPRFVKNPANWLACDAWLNDPEPEREQDTRAATREPSLDELRRTDPDAAYRTAREQQQAAERRMALKAKSDDDRRAGEWNSRYPGWPFMAMVDGEVVDLTLSTVKPGTARHAQLFPQLPWYKRGTTLNPEEVPLGA